MKVVELLVCTPTQTPPGPLRDTFVQIRNFFTFIFTFKYRLQNHVDGFTLVWTERKPSKITFLLTINT